MPKRNYGEVSSAAHDTPRYSYQNLLDVVNFAHDAEREVLLDTAEEIDPRLPDEIMRMIDQDGFSNEEIVELFDMIEPGLADQVHEQLDARIDAFNKPGRKTAR